MMSGLYTLRSLWRHYRNCRRNKRTTFNALAFEVDAEANLLDLQRELRAHTYRPGRSICFITEGPKPREVFAVDAGWAVVEVGEQPRSIRPGCKLRIPGAITRPCAPQPALP